MIKRLLIFTLVLQGAIAAGQQCERLQYATPSTLASYLGGTELHADSACMAFAINQLGNLRHEPAILVLTKMLDFRWPRDAWQKQAYFPDSPDPASIRIFPAATALEQIGKNSLPAVLEAIKAPSTTRLGRETAVTVWMSFYKDERPRGVALLKQQADMTKDATARQRLFAG
jgi:hypothetical protein